MDYKIKLSSTLKAFLREGYSTHPPGFFGGKPFSSINKRLTSLGKKPTDWAIID